jgi:hypothetical protein
MSTSLQVEKYENSGLEDDGVQGALERDDIETTSKRGRRVRRPCHPQEHPTFHALDPTISIG